MSVIVLSDLEYYEIGKQLKLKFDFMNNLFRANQRAYDITYDLIQEIDQLDKSYYESLEFRKMDQEELNRKLRSIRYNIYPNNEDPEIDHKDLIKLDYLIDLTDVKPNGDQ